VVELAASEGLADAVTRLGLGRALGFVRMLQLGPDDLLTPPQPGCAALADAHE
jgi:hypothetical protein